jgi:SAM-dependent methyltransferase
MELGFRGEVADFYHAYRRGYPPAAIDALAGAFGLTARDVVVDLGCGTGQLTLPIAERVRAVVGVDPEPDMLARARRAATGRGLSNVAWLIGTDADLMTLEALLGKGSVGAVTIGQALHWMRHAELFHAARPLVRSGGGVAVVTNGTPLWLQDNGWSRALRAVLERWLGRPLTQTCGTDEESQQRYRESLAAAGFAVTTTVVEYADDLDLDRLVGGVYSAFSVDTLPPPGGREHLTAQIRAALAPQERFTEHVRVTLLTARTLPTP